MFKRPLLHRSTLKRIRQAVTIVAVLGLLVVNLPVPTAQAAAVTSLDDTLSRLRTSTLANHTIEFVTPTGVGNAAATTVTLTFAAGFTMGTFSVNNIDLGVDDDSACNGPFTDRTLAATNGADQWGVAQSGQVITFTGPSSGTTGVPATRCVQIEIGSNATSGAAGAAQITNPSSAASHTVAIGGTFGDTGTLAVSILADEQVAVTATVDPTITFTVDDNAIGFGALSASTGRWATGDALGGNASATTPTAAHTMTFATNAQSGYAITYNGATLTSGANTITDAAFIDEDSDGTPGSEQFGLGFSTSGNATIAANYLRDAVSDWDLVPSTTTTIVSETTSTATETISVSYLANIAVTTEAGSYSTTVTYVATATF